MSNWSIKIIAVIILIIVMILRLLGFPNRHVSLKEFISTLNSPLEVVVKVGTFIGLIILLYWFKVVRNK